MTVNKITNFITQQIQWGQFKKDEQFFSERQLAIKFNVSHSTAKNALIYAEAKGLLKSSRGKKRIVNDFGQNVFISKHLNIDKQKIIFLRKNKSMMSKEQLNIFKTHFKYHDLKKVMLIEIIYQKSIIGHFFATTNNHNFYNYFFNEEIDFLELLQKSKILISNIKKSIFVNEQKIIIKRYLYDNLHYLVEESCMIIDPNFYQHKTELKYHFNNYLF